MPKDIHWPKAKELLIEDIAAGYITDALSANEVRTLRDEYSKCIPENFKRNFYTLKKALKTKASAALKDAEYLACDRQIHPIVTFNHTNLSFRWCGSSAQHHLKQDVAEGRHLQLKPKDLWTTRDSYLDFPLDVFRQHYYQEIYSKLGKSYWQNRQASRNNIHP